MTFSCVNVLMHADLSTCTLVRSFKNPHEVEQAIKREVRYVLRMQGQPWSVPEPFPKANSVSSSSTESPHEAQLPEVCAVNTLPIDGAISAVLASVEYGPWTRCHVKHSLDSMRAVLYWIYAVRFVSHWVQHHFGASERRRRAGSGESPLVGVFVQRASVEQFTLGLITCGPPYRADIQQLCADFTEAVWKGKPFSQTSVMLPIGAALRQVTLAIWWTPQAARVVPHVPLPRIKIILKDRTCRVASHVSETCDETAPSSWAPCGRVVFKAYHTARLFVARPFECHLDGTVMYPVPHDLALARSSHETEGRAALPSPRPHAPPVGGCQRVDAPPPGDTTQPYVDESEVSLETTTSGLAFFSINARQSAEAHLLFTDVTLSQVGEYLIGVEVLVDAPYKAFVPVLCAHLAPFLVVADASA